MHMHMHMHVHNWFLTWRFLLVVVRRSGDLKVRKQMLVLQEFWV